MSRDMINFARLICLMGEGFISSIICKCTWSEEAASITTAARSGKWGELLTKSPEVMRNEPLANLHELQAHISLRTKLVLGSQECLGKLVRLM